MSVTRTERPAPVGREPELELLRTPGGTVVVTGPPGIGRTVLLAHVAATAGGPVLAARGRPSERDLPFVVLADLLQPLRTSLAALPDAQRTALESAFALASSGTAPNPYAVGVATHALLARGPLTLLIDDVDHADTESIRTLLFALRRLPAGRVTVVWAGRDVSCLDAGRAGWPVVTLGPLGRAEARRALAQHGYDVTERVLDALLDVGGGNPAALLDAAAGLRSAQRAGQEPLPPVLPVGDRLRAAWAERLAALDAQARSALTLVAACRHPGLDLLDAALADAGLDLADLGDAERAGLLRLTPDAGYELDSPVLRSVLLHTAPVAVRREVFRALAAVTPEPERTWYLSRAGDLSSVGDPNGTGYLSRTGPTPAERSSGQLVGTVAELLDGGDAWLAARWAEQTALRTPADPRLRADLELYRGRAYGCLGLLERSRSTLVEAADAVRPVDPERAEVLLTEAVLAATLNADVPAALRITGRFAPEPVPPLVLARRTHPVALTLDVAEHDDVLDAALRSPNRPDPATRLTLARSCVAAERFADARRVLDRPAGAESAATLPLLLLTRAELDRWTGHWASARAGALQAGRLAGNLGQRHAAGAASAFLAHLEAACGRAARLREHVEQAQAAFADADAGLADVVLSAALGLDALARGDAATAVSHLDAAHTRAIDGGITNPSVVPFAADRVEAHLRAGDRASAEKALEELVGAAAVSARGWQRAAAARCAGLLAGIPGDAEEQFRRAERLHRQQDTPYELARTLLGYGEALRRFRRPAAAREPLLEAERLFRTLSAAPWARRAAAELAASGARPVTAAPLAGSPGVGAVLSPQELEVATTVARGATNAEAAAALYLSPKTVEAHLTRAYRKLGLRSRAELARRLSRDGTLE
ncbi:LuxR C-terminal-related transcriptional regulator [Cryptosporangium sp. NPDC051539]|uniref:helix-turn-helix transcriptional regulator n=1 Tax=Cryptosporangium sp. NPDC051539 TaxID=3363962 RepID=UPI0037BBA94E